MLRCELYPHLQSNLLTLRIWLIFKYFEPVLDNLQTWKGPCGFACELVVACLHRPCRCPHNTLHWSTPMCCLVGLHLGAKMPTFILTCAKLQLTSG